MTYRFTNLDNELEAVQLENIFFNRKKLKKNYSEDKMIYLDFVNIGQQQEFLTSENFYNNLVFDVTQDTDIETNDNIITKDDAIDIFFDQLNIYYVVFNLPVFSISDEELVNYLSILYDYITENNKGNFLELIDTINKYVLADALVNQKSCIRIIDYIDKLKYLLFFDFTKEEIENIRKKIGFKKIVNFQRIHKKEN